MSQNLKRADSNITEDSLETKPAQQERVGKEHFEKYPSHIHVPFQHRDNIPKQESYLKISNEKWNKIHPKLSKTNECKNYLTLNKRPRKQKTYLERFREKFSKIITVSAEEKLERISLEGEFGDTARRDSEAESIRSIGGNSIVQDFFDTECYNEMCYQNLMNEDRYFDKRPSVGEELKMDLASINPSTISGGTTTKSGFPTSSVLTSGTRRSESMRSTSQVLRGSTKAPSDITRLKGICTRSTGGVRSSCQGVGGRDSVIGTEYNVPLCRLGSLGPDVETLRPRLERARSVQRYSERVRIDNKLKARRHKSLQTGTQPLTAEPSHLNNDKSSKNNNHTKIQNITDCKVVKHSKSDQSTLKERDKTMLNKNKLKLNVKKQAEEDFSKGDSKIRSPPKTVLLQNLSKLDELDRRQLLRGERLRELEERHSALQAAVRGHHPHQHHHHPHQHQHHPQHHRSRPVDNTAAALSGKSYIWKH